jgi:hypothetical protein
VVNLVGAEDSFAVVRQFVNQQSNIPTSTNVQWDFELPILSRGGKGEMRRGGEEEERLILLFHPLIFIIQPSLFPTPYIPHPTLHLNLFQRCNLF